MPVASRWPLLVFAYTAELDLGSSKTLNLAKYQSSVVVLGFRLGQQGYKSLHCAM